MAEPPRRSIAARVALPTALGVAVAMIAHHAVTGPASASAAVAAQNAAPTRVAVVRLEDLLEGLNEQAELQAALDALIREKEQELEGLATEIRAIEGDLAVFPEGTTERRDKILELQEKRAAANFRGEAIERLVSEETGTMLLGLFAKIRETTAEVARDQGWDVVLVDDSGVTVPPRGDRQLTLRFINDRRVLFANDSVDITDDVRQTMNRRHAVGP